MSKYPTRRLAVTMFMSLDGVVESPEKWSFHYWNDEIAKFKLEELRATDALLLGRVTYEGFAAAWPSRKDPEGFADRFNGMPKHVASKTLKKLEWNNSHLIKGELAAVVSILKQEPGQDTRRSRSQLFNMPTVAERDAPTVDALPAMSSNIFHQLLPRVMQHLPGNRKFRPRVAHAEINNVGGCGQRVALALLVGIVVTCIDDPPFTQSPAQSRFNRIVSTVAAGNDVADIMAFIGSGTQTGAERF